MDVDIERLTFEELRMLISLLKSELANYRILPTGDLTAEVLCGANYALSLLIDKLEKQLED